jgi:hypothetical protein
MNELLEKVEHDLGFASDGLREALHKANAVEALVLLPLIKQVNDARNEVTALFAARISDTANILTGGDGLADMEAGEISGRIYHRIEEEA